MTETLRSRSSSILFATAFASAALVAATTTVVACGNSDDTDTGSDGGGGSSTPDASAGGNDGGSTGTTDSGGGGGNDSGATGDSGGGTSTGFHAITLPDPNSDESPDRVTGIYCTAVGKCVVATDAFGDEGHVYATDGKTITATLVTGSDTYAAKFNTVGDMGFNGFAVVGGLVIANTIDAEQGLVSASTTGDITAVASWTGVAVAPGNDSFALNTQYGWGASGTGASATWDLVSNGRIWSTTGAPSATSNWTNIYSPQAVPSIPAGIADMHTADPTLCDSDPTVSVSPVLAQSTYTAPDLSIIISPAGTVNQDGDDAPGVCISVDKGKTFRHAAFTGVGDGEGPTGVTCTTKDHCIAFGGLPSQDNSAYIYVSANASSGATSAWTKATFPTVPTDTLFRAVSFAPDALHGWLVGSNSNNGSLLFTTTDGGTTWTDASASISAATMNNRLHSVYAFDATHVFIGGEQQTLIASGF